MTPTRMTLAAISIVALALGGCRYNAQTTSGFEFVTSSPSSAVLDGDDIDSLVLQVAAVEPTLRFPARIGLARIHDGDLAPIPSAEAEAWLAAEERLGPAFGTFVPVNHLIAEVVTTSVAGGNIGNGQLERTVNKIRLGAARQHLDAVLIYETRYIADSTDNFLSAADFTIVGAFLFPGQSIDATAFATALFIDVRNGYPYGSAEASVDEGRVATLVSSSSIGAEMGRDASTAAAVLLVDDVEQMMRDVKRERDLAGGP